MNAVLFDKYKNKSQLEIDSSLVSACMFGQLEEVRYLLNSKELPINANLWVFDGMALQYACYYEKLEVAKYLLTSDELKEVVDINRYKKPTELLHNFIKTGNLEAVKFFLSEQFKPSIKLSKVSEYTFDNLNDENLNIASYLIFDLNMKRTKPINEILLIKPSEKIEQMFSLRETNQTLNKDLVSKKINPKKIKI